MPTMTQTPKTGNKALNEHLSPANEDTSADYITWKKQKVEKALEQSKDRTKMTPADKVWERLGLEH